MRTGLKMLTAVLCLGVSLPALAASVERERPQALNGASYAVIGPLYVTPPFLSYIRLFNGGATPATFTVSVVGSGTANTYGTATYTVPAGATRQLPMFTILVDANAVTRNAADAQFSFYVQSPQALAGYQHVTLEESAKFFGNASVCKYNLQDVVRDASNQAVLPSIHTTRLSTAGYPSQIELHNFANAAVTYRFDVRDEATGTSVGQMNFPARANASYTIPWSQIESAIGFNPTENQIRANLIVTDPAGVPPAILLGQTIVNTTLGVSINMTNACAVNPGSAATKRSPSVFDIQSVNFYDFPYFPNHQGMPDAYDLRLTKELFTDYKRMGANTITLGWAVPVDENSGRMGTAFAQADRFHAPSIAEIRALALVAQEVGLSVILKPQANSVGAIAGIGFPTNISDGQTPNVNATTFLTGWATYMQSVAELAQEVSATMVVVGTENGGFEGTAHRALWANVISGVRARYKGLLTYHALTLPARVSFWDLVDVIGLDVYYPLASKENPSYAEVLASWTNNAALPLYMSPDESPAPVNIVAALKALSDRYSKPIYFGETGIQSMRGAMSHDSTKGALATPTDQLEQALYFQSMFQALSTANRGWFKGVNIWASGSDSPPKSALGFTDYLTNQAAVGPPSYEVRGKIAEKVIASWFGGTNHIGWNDATFTGSLANDRIALYGDGVTVAAGQNVSQSATFRTTASFTVSGPILNNDGYTLHPYMNGVDLGAQKVVGSHFLGVGPIDALGMKITTRQTLQVSLPGLVPLTEFKVVVDNPVLTGVEPTQSFMHDASINGISLSAATYFGGTGPGQAQVIGKTSGTYGAGYQVLDGSPWNSSLGTRKIGTITQPIQVTGGGGTDTVYVLGTRSAYTITGIGTAAVTLRETAGLDQNAVLNNISFVVFQDGATLNTTTGAVN